MDGKMVPSLLVPILCLFVFLPEGSRVSEASLPEEARQCLECHGRPGITKTFRNGESIHAYVDREDVESSVHSYLSCSDCHRDFSPAGHPRRRFRSKKQYKLRSSRACRRCHGDGDIERNPIHAGLLSGEKRGEYPVCADCHGAHSVMPVADGRIYADEKEYCQGCHGHDLEMPFKEEGLLSLKVDMAGLGASVHSKLTCSDCHYGFSREEHPRRFFRTARDYAIASSESCRRCHFDKYTKTLESIHYTMLSQGNLKAPVCTDCHGSHSVSYVRKERTFSARKCRKCHPGVYGIYAKSVHGSALFNESNQDVPVCIDCHKVHDIRNPLTLEYHERIPEMCSNCHANSAVVGKYGLSTDVVKTYLSDFHGITLGFYKKQREADFYRPARPIAVCTDCHGIHDISSTIGPDATVVKANLVKRCRKCHEDATENFPDAWLSHYEPTLSRAPMVFIITWIYKILIPLMMAGLGLQILLHIWRYAVNR